MDSGFRFMVAAMERKATAGKRKVCAPRMLPGVALMEQQPWKGKDSKAVSRERPDIVILVPYYLPGYKAGGPIRTVSATVERLRDDFRFWVVTSDRDAGDRGPYPEARDDGWMEKGAAYVRYVAPDEQSLVGLHSVLSSVAPDLIYLNAFYHPVFTFRVLLLRRLGLITQVPVVLAPRGHLSSSARSVKPWRKNLYIMLVKVLGLAKNVVFHASGEIERREIREVFPDADVRVAPNIFPPPDSDSQLRETIARGKGKLLGKDRVLQKEPGTLRVVFLSRVVPQKNLKGALQAMRHINGRAHLAIVGPIGDERYWSSCKRTIKRLPEHVTAEYRGALPHRVVPDVLAENHLFFLPTRSESYGHAIREALKVGRPVLISDQTPWTDVEVAGAGWICPLEDTSCYRKRLEYCLAMNQEEFETHCKAARGYLRTVTARRDAETRTRALLNDIIQEARGAAAV